MFILSRYFLVSFFAFYPYFFAGKKKHLLLIFVMNQTYYSLNIKIMKTNNKKLAFMATGLMISVFIFAACSSEKMEELEADANKSKTAVMLTEEFDLKAGNTVQNQILAEIRKATARYHRFDAAVQDGYALDPHCVEHPEFGGMGFHAIHYDRIGPFVNPSEPGVLVYEPSQNGKLKLVAAEFLVPAEPWDSMNQGPPMLGEIEFDDHREIIYVENEHGELVPVNAKGGPPFPHYQIHVWVWKNNPNGIYSPFNPNVSCEYAGFVNIN